MQAILLDMDGTLVDSDAAVERAWQAWAREYGVHLAGTPAFLHGSPALRSVQRLRPDLDDEAAVAAAGRQLALQYDDLSDVRATPGTSELLAELTRRQLPWAVVTSADVRLARARLGAAGVRAPLLVTAEDVRAEAGSGVLSPGRAPAGRRSGPLPGGGGQRGRGDGRAGRRGHGGRAEGRAGRPADRQPG